MKNAFCDSRLLVLLLKRVLDNNKRKKRDHNWYYNFKHTRKSVNAMHPRTGYRRIYLVPLTFIACLSYYFLFQPQKAKEIGVASKREAEDFKIALMKGQNHGFVATTRKNRGKPTGSAVCNVDPAITDCSNMGFAAFLLHTLDHIMLCRALGINRPTVHWRACYSVCSGDPRVNSWDWYFEHVNQGLESKVENVLCPLMINDLGDYLRPILDYSFKNRTDVDGYEHSKIITTQERMRINKLIQQYVKPNSRIREKVRTFYHRYLAGFTVLGVHVRGTDHWAETSEQRLPPLTSWVERAQSILETLPRPRKIFIASDNNEVIKKFVTYFGKETVSFKYLCVTIEVH